MLAGALLLALLVVVWMDGSLIRLPWQPECAVLGDDGSVLADGSPDEIVAVLDDQLDASGDLAGRVSAGPALTCSIPAIAVTGERKRGPVGLTPAASRMRAEVRRAFGALPDGGYGPEAVLPGRAARGEHSLGRAVDFFFRPYDDADQVRRGWRLANWAVANAQRLRIRTVIYADHIWTARRSSQGWREYTFRGPAPDSPVNRHLDHVHIDVA